jgi:hypothetical protein
MPELTLEERLEVESDRRRRVNAAFRLGSEASPGASGPGWLGPLATGIAIAIAVALVMGVITLARTTSTSSNPSAAPTVTSSPNR